jgi:hypothetical protein
MLAANAHERKDIASQRDKPARLINFLRHSGERFPTAWEMRAVVDAALQREREYGAAPTTIEALMWGLRSEGIAHLNEPRCRRRLMDCSPDQVREIIARLLGCRETYPGRDPGISDELLLALRNLLRAEEAR